MKQAYKQGDTVIIPQRRFRGFILLNITRIINTQIFGDFGDYKFGLGSTNSLNILGARKLLK